MRHARYNQPGNHSTRRQKKHTLLLTFMEAARCPDVRETIKQNAYNYLWRAFLFILAAAILGAIDSM